MANSLTGYIVDSKGDVLHLSNSGAGLTSSYQTVYDGVGNASALLLSTAGTKLSNGTFTADSISYPGNLTISANSGAGTLIFNAVLSFGTSTFGNINIATNTISSTNSNGNINLTPNGTGSVVISKGNITMTAGSITGITPLAIAYGGTGSATAAAAVAALSLTIGTNTQAWGANLDAL